MTIVGLCGQHDKMAVDSEISSLEHTVWIQSVIEGSKHMDFSENVVCFQAFGMI